MNKMYDSNSIRNILVTGNSIQSDKVNNSRKLTKLSGPHYFLYFKIPDGRKILFLGETHNLEGICNDSINTYPIHKWLYDLILNGPECVDLFVEDDIAIEMPYEFIEDNGRIEKLSNYSLDETSKRGYSSGRSGLAAIKNTFEDCKYLNSDCPLNKLRYHFIDARIFKYINSENNFKINVGEILYIYNNSNQLINEDDRVEAKLFLDQNKEKIFKYYIGYDSCNTSKKLFKEYVNLMIKNSTLEIDDIDSDNYRKKYLNLINKQIKKN